MEKIGTVSLWLGTVPSNNELKKFVEIKYSEDGDCLPSLFLTEYDVDINEFDEDFIEAHYHDKLLDKISDLIRGCSYDSIVIPRFCSLYGDILSKRYNAIILVYNFEYNGTEKHYTDGINNFLYFGSVEYK